MRSPARVSDHEDVQITDGKTWCSINILLGIYDNKLVNASEVKNIHALVSSCGLI